MAGNTLLISPELLVKEGFLEATDLEEGQLRNGKKVDYEDAQRVKIRLFDKAYANYSLSDNRAFADQFKLFCETESSWLNDFSLYQVLKEQNAGKPWFEWSAEYKLRDEEALKEFAEKNSEELEKIKWLQFIFIKQFNELRSYCNSLGIQLFGDLPFYISYDSVDVWSNPEIFSLDEEGNMVGVAGVPPDYFNSDGQLWGMPVFRWDELKKDGYKWWIQRLKKNLELYDVLRLDHFRAFSAYWEVPASEKTAINGQWKQGPGADFFTAVQKDLGELPFIAEDLGDIDDKVYLLRDRFKLPGMKVLQFAFGDDMPQSQYTPHNYSENFIVYTGTHDNNTSKGWFLKDADKETKKRLKRYVGGPVNEKNVHKVLSRLAYASVAKIVILPLQDILGLDDAARMNTPASKDNNWSWRLKPGQLTSKVEKRLRKWTEIYNRA
jgi:4-alpha-glucanotransferase